MFDSCNAAAEQHLRNHEPLVRRIAQRIRSRTPDSVQLDDLVQVGMIAVAEAMSRFDERRGASFGTYASRRIEGAMLDSLRQDDRLPRSVRLRVRQLAAAVQQLEHRLGRSPRAQELADELGWSLADVHKCMADAGAGKLRDGDVPLEAAVDADEVASNECSVDDHHSDPVRSLQWQQRYRALESALEQLSERQRYVIEMIYDHGLSLADIGRTLGVSESRVSQVHAQVVGRLQQQLSAW